MNLAAVLIVAAVVFGVCYAVDRLFTKLFRNKAQHQSGKAVRANKRYGIFGLILAVLGIMGLCAWNQQDMVLRVCGFAVLVMGGCMIAYYLSFGIFYNGESFLVSSFGKKSCVYHYGDIVQQRLFAVSGGNVIVELEMKNGKTIALQSAMDGVYPFLDFAFSAWCRQTGREPETCDFHDPSKSWWFPHGEEL